MTVVNRSKVWNINRWNKAIVVLLAFTLPVVADPLLSWRAPTPAEWGLILTAVFVNFGVWLVANTPELPYLKGIVSILGVGATMYVSAATDNVIAHDEKQAVIAAIAAAVLTILVPNAKTPPRATPRVFPEP